MSDPSTVPAATPVLDPLSRLTEAWNAGNADAYAAEFTDDATYVVFNGVVLHGQAAIADSHRFLFDGPLHGSRMITPEEGAMTLRFLRADLAHLVTSGAVLLPGRSEVDDDRRSTASYVLVAQDGVWKVTAFQNTRAPRPEAGP